ncbi:carbon storage regulator, CsrA [Paenibacillus sp. UNC496MF]|uniref:carbon storage regulator n=1 Tax=Paenibacillus sp. UNC496MF TaxID=1502753 RepID=UPI0008EEB835|nr:carbon storage regulator [Paenibacillus sp. UNC496MF]SFJ63144.1 carbon storage regulator, CsrA [Paenibacillus sp. UNC496MF]
MALVLGRKPNESIIINGNIVVTVIKTEDDMLRLKIEAPKEISIVRAEIADK